MAHPIQIILARQLAAYLSTPLLLVDPKGNLIFYNEPAEAMLGSRFDETGVLPPEEWLSKLPRVDDEGHPIPFEDIATVSTLTKMRPTHKRYHTTGLDGVVRHVELTSIPITDLLGNMLGAATFFWEISE